MEKHSGLTPFGMDLYAYLVQHQCIMYQDVYDVFDGFFSEEVYLTVINDMIDRGYLTRSGYGHECRICLA